VSVRFFWGGGRKNKYGERQLPPCCLWLHAWSLALSRNLGLHQRSQNQLIQRNASGAGRLPGGAGTKGQMTPRNLHGVKHGILTPRFFGDKYFLAYKSVDSQQNHYSGQQLSVLQAKMHQIQFGWGSAPDPDGEAYSASPGSLDLSGPPRNVVLIILTPPQSKNNSCGPEAASNILGYKLQNVSIIINLQMFAEITYSSTHYHKQMLIYSICLLVNFC